MAELYLVRHGQASFGSDNYDQLSELGEQQAYWLGQYFAQRNMVFDQVMIGTQVRHRQTAESIFRGMADAMGKPIDQNKESDAQNMSHAAPFKQHAGLNEYDFYALNAALCEQHPEFKTMMGKDKASFYKGLKQALLLWSSNQLGGHLPETWQTFVARVSDALQWIQSSNAKRVLVVSSAGPIATLTHQVLQCPAAIAVELNMQIYNTSICHYYFNANTAKLASFNTIPHLDQSNRRDAITHG
jgi:broad specificity phosphatase PhoE